MSNYSMYACPECKKAFKVKGSDKKVSCPQCKSTLLVDLKMEYDEWNSLSKSTREDILRVKLVKMETDTLSNAETETETETNSATEEDKRRSFFDEAESKDVAKSFGKVNDEVVNNTKTVSSKHINPKFVVAGASVAVVLVVGIIIISLKNGRGLSADTNSANTKTFSNNGMIKKAGSENFNKALELIQEGDLSRALGIYRTLSQEEKAMIDENIMENVTDYAHFISRLFVEEGMEKTKECLEVMAPSASKSVEFQQGVFSEVMTLLNNDNVSDATVLKSIITDEELIDDFYNACYNIANENLANGICDSKTSKLYGYLPGKKYPDAYAYKYLVDMVIDIREKPTEISIKYLPTIIKTGVIDECPEDCKEVIDDMKTELEQMSGCYSDGLYYIAIKNYKMGMATKGLDYVFGLEDAEYNKNNKTFIIVENVIKKSGNSIAVDGGIYNIVSEGECPVSLRQMDVAGTAPVKTYKAEEPVKKEKKSEEKIDPYIGMSEKTLVEKSWGKPKKKNVTEHAWGTYEQWVYSTTRYVYLDNGIVTGIQYSE